jgi:hypothetical protein
MKWRHIFVLNSCCFIALKEKLSESKVEVLSERAGGALSVADEFLRACIAQMLNA